MVGSSQIDHDIASGAFLHMIPTTFNPSEESHNLDLALTGPETERKPSDANVDEVGFSREERLENLKNQYIAEIARNQRGIVCDPFTDWRIVRLNRKEPVKREPRLGESANFRTLAKRQ